MAFHLWPRQHTPTIPQPLPPTPARVLLRAVPPVLTSYSLRHALTRFRQHQVGGLPVTRDGELIGWVTETAVSEALTTTPEAAEYLPIDTVMQPLPATVLPDASGDALLAPFQATGCLALPVVTEGGQYLGCVTWLDALAARDGWFPPPRIGGMATPLGVYLTTGVVSGGVGPFALMLTGAQFALMMWLAQTGLWVLVSFIGHATYSMFLQDLAGMLWQDASLTDTSAYSVTVLLTAIFLLFGSFMALLRVLPRVAGYHAAEHQTVNAIEAGEPLTPEAVGRMSRVHPRCGTNLWGIMAMTQFGVSSLLMVQKVEFLQHNPSLLVTVATFATLLIALSWKRIGGWLQEHLTTRPPTPVELASGVAAGQELLRRHLETGALTPRPGQRLWRMGFLQVLCGVVITVYLLELLGGLWQILVK